MPARPVPALLVLLLTAAPAVAQDDAAPGAAAAPDAAMMRAWQRAAAPGPGHARLDAMVGAWDVAGTIYMGPGVPPIASAGTQVNRWTLGGRWLNGEYEGAFMGMPFSGLSRWGYDNAARKYVSTWTDTASTGLTTDTGTYDGKLSVSPFSTASTGSSR